MVLFHSIDINKEQRNVVQSVNVELSRKHWKGFSVDHYLFLLSLHIFFSHSHDIQYRTKKEQQKILC